MAKKYSANTRFYYGGYEPGTATTRIAMALEVASLDPTALGDAAERVLAGERKDTGEYAGLFDDGADGLDAAQAALLQTGTAAMSMLIGTAVGDVAYSGTAYLLAAKPISKRGDLVRLEASFKPDQAWQRGLLLAARQGFTGSANTGTVDAAGATAGYNFYVHVFSFSGSGTAIVHFQNSADGTAWTNYGASGTLVGINGRSSYKGGSAAETTARYNRALVAQDATAVLNAAIILMPL